MSSREGSGRALAEEGPRSARFGSFGGFFPRLTPQPVLSVGKGKPASYFESLNDKQ